MTERKQPHLERKKKAPTGDDRHYKEREQRGYGKDINSHKRSNGKLDHGRNGYRGRMVRRR